MRPLMLLPLIVATLAADPALAGRASRPAALTPAPRRSGRPTGGRSRIRSSSRRRCRSIAPASRRAPSMRAAARTSAVRAFLRRTRSLRRGGSTGRPSTSSRRPRTTRLCGVIQSRRQISRARSWPASRATSAGWRSSTGSGIARRASCSLSASISPGTSYRRARLVLHGETEVKKRKELVRRFQEDEAISFFVLSLKAGGAGLNLTAASHVIHFDRWWNPAVENQATDRAFRIGQT